MNGDEIVDDPGISRADARDTVRDQAVMNRWFGGVRAVLAHAGPWVRGCGADPVRVLDAGCGGGDISRRVVDMARALGRQLEVTALDLSIQVIDCATQQSVDYPEIRFVNADALHPPFQRGEFDLVILSTFIHHLQPDEVVAMFRVAKEISRGAVIVADLVRSPLAFHGFRLIARLARLSPVTIHDGEVSFRRAYTPGEFAEFARRAGLERWKVYRHLFYRMTLVYEG